MLNEKPARVSDEPNFPVIKTGTLNKKTRSTIFRSFDHFVYIDMQGREFVQIYSQVEKQLFVASFLDGFGIPVSKIFKYVTEDGDVAYLSEVPRETDFAYSLNGKIKGISNMFLLCVLVGDADKRLNEGMLDTTVADKKGAHNLNINLGNMSFYDFEAASFDASPVETLGMLNYREGSLDELFCEGEIIEYKSFDEFIINVWIVTLSELQKIKQRLIGQGMKDLISLLKSLNMPSIPSDKSDTLTSFLSLVLARVEAAEKYFAEKLGATEIKK